MASNWHQNDWVSMAAGLACSGSCGPCGLPGTFSKPGTWAWRGYAVGMIGYRVGSLKMMGKHLKSHHLYMHLSQFSPLKWQVWISPIFRHSHVVGICWDGVLWMAAHGNSLWKTPGRLLADSGNLFQHFLVNPECVASLQCTSSSTRGT